MNRDMLSDIEFDKQIQTMPDRKLLELVARQTFSITQKVKDHEERIKALESRDKKIIAVIGGSSALMGSAVAALVRYLVQF